MTSANRAAIPSRGRSHRQGIYISHITDGAGLQFFHIIDALLSNIDFQYARSFRYFGSRMSSPFDDIEHIWVDPGSSPFLPRPAEYYSADHPLSAIPAKVEPMLLGVLADETYSYQNARAAMADVEFSANDRPIRLMRPFTVSFYRLVTRYPASTFRHYLASYAAIEDAEAMEDYSLVSRLRGVHELGLPFSAMCDDVLPPLRHTWIWENARCGADAPPQRLAALAAAQDITNIAMLEAVSDTTFFRSHGVNYPWELRVPTPTQPTPPAQPVACFAMDSQVLPSPEEAPVEELSPLSDSGVALAGLLFGDDSWNRNGPRRPR